MSFFQTGFILFHITLLFLFYIPWKSKGNPQHLILLSGSLIFYAWWDYRFVVVLLWICLFDYLSAQAIAKTENLSVRKRWVVASISNGILLLLYFKYTNFFIASFCQMAGIEKADCILVNILLPLGISYFVFSSVSYTIDVFRGATAPVDRFHQYVLFIVFYPKIIAGPIVRWVDFFPQLKRPVRFETENLSAGLRLFVAGAAKKLLIADQLSLYVDTVFSNFTVFDSPTLWAAAVAYSLQIYFDFSGYSDMAIGLARMFGIDLGVNFRFPYLAGDFSDFWRRWHISLSTWIRDYLYFPLGGGRKGPARTLLNLFTAMTFCGLWHGANWTFVFWGMMHGAGLSVQRIGLLKNRWFTLLTIMLGWVVFRSDNIGQATVYMYSMVVPTAGVFWISPLVPVAVFVTTAVHLTERYRWSTIHHLPPDHPLTPAILLSLIWLMMMFYPVGFSPFIYAQF